MSLSRHFPLLQEIPRNLNRLAGYTHHEKVYYLHVVLAYMCVCVFKCLVPLVLEIRNGCRIVIIVLEVRNWVFQEMWTSAYTNILINVVRIVLHILSHHTLTMSDSLQIEKNINSSSSKKKLAQFQKTKVSTDWRAPKQFWRQRVTTIICRHVGIECWKMTYILCNRPWWAQLRISRSVDKTVNVHACILCSV